jgi:uncharacterized membrane protein
MPSVSILKCAIVAGEGSSKPTMLSSFHSLSFSDVLLATGVALEHNLFLCPLVISFGFLHFWLRLGFFLFVLLWLATLFNGVYQGLFTRVSAE